MNKLFILPFVLCLFIVTSCGKKEDTSVKKEVNVPVYKDGIKIAYYIQDSLKTKYHYYSTLDSIVKNKQLSFQRELEKRQTSLQNYINDNDAKANKGLLSAFDIQKVQEEIQRRQQNLYQYQQNEGAKIENETNDHLEVLTNRIDDAAKQFCKEKNIDVLMMQGLGSGLTYISEDMDVTDAFTDFLNEYQRKLDEGISKKK